MLTGLHHLYCVTIGENKARAFGSIDAYDQAVVVEFLKNTRQLFSVSSPRNCDEYSTTAPIFQVAYASFHQVQHLYSPNRSSNRPDSIKALQSNQLPGLSPARLIPHPGELPAHA